MKKLVLVAAMALSTCVLAQEMVTKPVQAYHTPQYNAKKKAFVDALLAKMTVEEKMSQMLYESPAIERLNIPAYNWWNEALHGVARAGVWKQNSPAGYAGSLREGTCFRGGDHRSGGAPDGSSYSSGYDEGLSVPV